MSVNLATQTNDFTTIGVSATTGNAAVTDSNDLDLGATSVNGSLSVVAGGALTQSAALALTGAANFNATSITLTNGGNDFSSIGLTSACTVNVSDTVNDLDLTASNICGALSLNVSGNLTHRLR